MRTENDVSCNSRFIKIAQHTAKYWDRWIALNGDEIVGASIPFRLRCGSATDRIFQVKNNHYGVCGAAATTKTVETNEFHERTRGWRNELIVATISLPHINQYVK